MNNENGYKKNDYEKMKCIWMSSMVVDYKLCDNHFNCDRCLFDKVMRNLMSEEDARAMNKNAVELVSDKLQRLKFDEKIIYLKNNFVAKVICRDTFYLGINPILTSFLDASSSLVMYECGENITIGQPVMKIQGTWGKLDLTAPVNFSVYDKVAGYEENPWKSRWIAIIGGDHNEIVNCGLSGPEWDIRHQKALDAIGEVKQQMSRVGETMFDGGARITSLHQYLGNKKYRNILKLIAE